MADDKHILIVEDDHEIRKLLGRLLREAGYRVSAVADGKAMDLVIADSRIDLILLDLMLPGEDGLAICRRLRQKSRLPIIFVSARGDEVDRILGLEMGADDYVSKPFNPREVLARIRAVLRRGTGAEDLSGSEAHQVYDFAGWRLDARRRILTDAAGARVSVTDAEFDLLRVFCSRPGKLLSRDQLIDITQGREAGPNERSIDILVARLRRKLALAGLDEGLIATVRSSGYMFTPEVVAA